MKEARGKWKSIQNLKERDCTKLAQNRAQYSWIFFGSTNSILGVFALPWNTPITFVMSARLSVSPSVARLPLTGFPWHFDIWDFHETLSRIIKMWLKSGEKNYRLPYIINTLNPELNPICYLLALLGAHHFLHVSRIRVKLLNFRRLMSYIYIYIYGAPILDVSRSHTTTQHSR